jgi:hypothetical protein
MKRDKASILWSVDPENAVELVIGVIRHTLCRERAQSYSPGLRGTSYPGFEILP